MRIVGHLDRAADQIIRPAVDGAFSPALPGAAVVPDHGGDRNLMVTTHRNKVTATEAAPALAEHSSGVESNTSPSRARAHSGGSRNPTER